MQTELKEATMPGSVTIGHFHPTVTLGHDDAERLSRVLVQLTALLETTGPDRVTDAQAGALCGGRPEQRAEFTEWTRRLTHHLQAHL
jgi:hypothetical protein